MGNNQNQYTARRPRLHRVPSIAVTEEERQQLEAFHAALGVSFGQMVRLGLIAAGFLTSDSLDEADGSVPMALVRAAMKGEASAVLPKK